MSEQAYEAHGSDIEEAIQNGLRRLGLGRTDVIIDVVDEGRKGLLGLGSREAVVRLTPLAGADVAEAEEEAAAPAPVPAPVTPEEITPAEETPEPEEQAPLAEAATPLPEVEEAEEPEPAETETLPVEAPGILPETETAEAEAPAVEAPAALAEPAPTATPSTAEEQAFDEDEELAEAVQEIVETLLEKLGFADAGVTIRQGEPDDRTGRVMTIVEIQGGDEVKNLIGPHGEVLSDLQYVARLMTGHVIKRRANFLLDVNGYRRRREEALAKLAERMAGKAVRRGEPVTLEAMNAYDRRIIHIALRDHEDVYTNSVGEGANRRVRIYLQE